MSEQQQFDAEKHLVIAGKIYLKESFSPQQAQAIAMINFADQELANIAARRDIQQMGRDRMVELLIENISDIEPIGTVPAPEPVEEAE